MQAVRIRFKKQGNARYISHLDLNRCMLRAIRRAGLPLWYTQGFNPHPYITIALPLSIFYESGCEVMDARLAEDIPFNEVKDRLSAQMPEGIEVYDAYEPLMKVGDIAFARWDAILEFELNDAVKLNEIVNNLLQNETVIIEKLTKHGVRRCDIRPFLDRTCIFAEDGLIRFDITLPAGQETINPSCIEAAISDYEGIKPDFSRICRTAILNTQLEQFR